MSSHRDALGDEGEGGGGLIGFSGDVSVSGLPDSLHLRKARTEEMS